MSDKSKYYTSAETYTDDDDLTRNFTFIDHTKKSKLSGFIPDGSANAQHQKDRVSLLNRIFELSPTFCPEPFCDFLLRGESYDKIEWNKTMLLDDGIPFERLTGLYTLLSNRTQANNITY